ncbi:MULTISPECIES: hypothetical protein [unclassified Rhizobium]|uniref:hypothetical protein n=1 Tax=unclassified Rhizobium TaxID=2613769 RepID=UPI0037FBFE9F
MVVIDDEEAAFHQYSYGKYFGYVPLSENDQERLVAGEETVLDRTRLLFYVCCSRAVKDLAVVLFVPDVSAALTAITGKNLFASTSIRAAKHLDGYGEVYGNLVHCYYYVISEICERCSFSRKRVNHHPTRHHAGKL